MTYAYDAAGNRIRVTDNGGATAYAVASLGVKTLIVAGEPGGSIPATRAKLESLWPGARIFDHHGMTEVGPVTFECPAQPGVLHAICSKSAGRGARSPIR